MTAPVHRPSTGNAHRRVRPGFRDVSVLASSVIVALVLVASGCGGSDSSDDETLSLSSWKKQVNTLCAAARTDVDKIDTPEETTDYAGWETAALAVKKRINTFIDDVDQLGSPSSDSAKATAFMDQWRSYTGDFDGLVTAAKAEDSAKVEAALTDLQAANEKKDELAKGLGLDECYRTDDGGDDGSEPTDTLSKDPTTTTIVDESASGENLPPAEWSAQVDAACTALGEKYSTLGAADPQTVEEAKQVADDLSAFASELVAEWDRIGPPAGDTAQAQQLYDLFVRFSEIAADFQSAVAATDTAAIEQATTELDQVTTEMAPLAIALDVPSCGSN